MIRSMICEISQFNGGCGVQSQLFTQLQNSRKHQQIINVVRRVNFCSGSVENTVRERENAGYQHCLLFLQCFQKPFSRSLQVGIGWYRERLITYSGRQNLLELTLYHTVPTFDKDKSRLNTLWKKEKMLVTNVFPCLPHDIFYPFEGNSHNLSHNEFVVFKC